MFSLLGYIHHLIFGVFYLGINRLLDILRDALNGRHSIVHLSSNICLYSVDSRSHLVLRCSLGVKNGSTEE